MCSKFTGEHPCQRAISINLQSNVIEITLRHGCSPVNLLHIFGILFLRTPLEDCFRNNEFVRNIRMKILHQMKTENKMNNLVQFANTAKIIKRELPAEHFEMMFCVDLY